LGLGWLRGSDWSPPGPLLVPPLNIKLVLFLWQFYGSYIILLKVLWSSFTMFWSMLVLFIWQFDGSALLLLKVLWSSFTMFWSMGFIACRFSICTCILKAHASCNITLGSTPKSLNRFICLLQENVTSCPSTHVLIYLIIYCLLSFYKI
jgi:hypothetical protein